MSIEAKVKEIGELANAVREHINTHRYQQVLLEDTESWNQICSSLDVIEDSLLAVQSYDECQFQEDIGLSYIYTYGILQALFIMQDALRHLSEALDVPFELTQTLKEIRDVRNASIGHPTKQGSAGKRTYNHISRTSMGKSGFDLIRFSGDAEPSFTHVNVSQASSDQLDAVIATYRDITKKLQEVDRMHKEQFKDSPLTDIFHSAMGYFFEKIAQGIHAHSYYDRKFGRINLGQLKSTYEKFRSALSQRGELHDFTEFDLNEYFYAIGRLEEYFAGENETMEDSDARIYLSYLRNAHKHFVAIAGEVDEEYQRKA